MSKRVISQAIAAVMGAGAIGGYYSGVERSHDNGNDNYGNICRSEGAKQFKRKKNRRKMAKASRQRNRRG